MTEWKKFESLDRNRLRDTLRFPVDVNGRNLYQPQEMLDHGFTYFSVGRPASYLLQESKPRKLVVKMSRTESGSSRISIWACSGFATLTHRMHIVCSAL